VLIIGFLVINANNLQLLICLIERTWNSEYKVQKNYHKKQLMIHLEKRNHVACTFPSRK
jgi:hypothetical protein